MAIRIGILGAAKIAPPVVINPSRDSIAGAAGLPAVDAWLSNRHFAITHEDNAILASH